MTPLKTQYDSVIVGAGHNGLVAAAYLVKAGLSVLVLERNAVPGGATQSRQVFEGVEARLSVYSYLVSLFPGKIVDELGHRYSWRGTRESNRANGRHEFVPQCRAARFYRRPGRRPAVPRR